MLNFQSSDRGFNELSVRREAVRRHDSSRLSVAPTRSAKTRTVCRVAHPCTDEPGTSDPKSDRYSNYSARQDDRVL